MPPPRQDWQKSWPVLSGTSLPLHCHMLSHTAILLENKRHGQSLVSRFRNVPEPHHWLQCGPSMTYEDKPPGASPEASHVLVEPQQQIIVTMLFLDFDR